MSLYQLLQLRKKISQKKQRINSIVQSSKKLYTVLYSYLLLKNKKERICSNATERWQAKLIESKIKKAVSRLDLAVRDAGAGQIQKQLSKNVLLDNANIVLNYIEQNKFQTQNLLQDYTPFLYIGQFQFKNPERHMISKLYDVESSVCSCCHQQAQNDKNDQYWIKTNCNHFFHLQCLKEAMKFHKQCPICRQKIQKDPTYS